MTSRLDRAFIALGYCYAAVYGLLFLLFFDPRAPHEEDIWEFPLYAVSHAHRVTRPDERGARA